MYILYIFIEGQYVNVLIEVLSVFKESRMIKEGEGGLNK